MHGITNKKWKMCGTCGTDQEQTKRIIETMTKHRGRWFCINPDNPPHVVLFFLKSEWSWPDKIL